MKIRSLTANAAGISANAKRRGSRVLKVDPTRTGLLRRTFAAELKRKFRRLRRDVVKLIAEDDALGLRPRDPFATNAFCPTGPGGGVDPSCSPTSSGTSGSSKSAAEAKAELGKHALGAAVRVPLPVEPAPPYRGSADITAADRARAPVTDVPLEGLTATQSMVRRSTVEHFIDHPGGEPVDVVRAGGKLYVDDGTHRAVAAKFSGAKTIRARLFDHAPGAAKPVPASKPALNSSPGLTINAPSWRFEPDPEKVRLFREWLRKQLADRLRGKSEEDLWKAYVEEGFRRGAGRAFDDANNPKRAREARGKEAGDAEDKLDFYEGTKDQFMRSAFGRPEAVAKVKLLAGRSFDDLEGVTADMSLRMTRLLTDGLVTGKNPREIARGLADEVDVGYARAETIARTELIRAHAEGQLTAFEELGVEEVGVAVEWSTAGDERVCELCESLEGVVLKIDEARGMLPRHPR